MLTQAWPRVLPFSLFIGFLVLDSLVQAYPTVSAALGPADPWLYAIRVIVVLVVLLIVWPKLDELREGFSKDGLQDRLPLSASQWLAVISTGALVFVLWVNLGPLLSLSPYVPVTQPPWPADPVQASVWIGFRVFGAVLLVPVMEELFWRSYLMRRLDTENFLSLAPEKVSWFAVWASSFVFALAHRELLAAFITGVIYARLYSKLRSLWAPIVAHGVTNLCLAIYVLYTGRYEFW